MPVIPMGHSAHGQFAWKFAQWAPQRTVAAIPIKTTPLPPDLNLPGIPILYLVGETTEWPEYRDGRPGDRDFFWPVVRDSALRLRSANQDNLIAVATDPGGGHFDSSTAQGRLIALFIRKACQYRLPAHPPKDRPVQLRPLSLQSGWLTDSGGVLPDKWPPASYDKYLGNKNAAYWFFDREMALAAAAFDGDRMKRKKQMLTFEQDGQLLPVAEQGFAALRFEPEADSISFRLSPAFLTQVPSQLIGAGSPLGHVDGPIHLNVITGPAQQIGPDEFRVTMRRGDDGGDIWIEEEQDGNAEYRKAVQPGRMYIPARLTAGTPQSIFFAPLSNVKADASPIVLHATATSGLPVRFYVEYGSAILSGNKLILSHVPRFARRPIEVKVVAYQWGRMAAGAASGRVPSAEPVMRTFLVMPPVALSEKRH